MPRSTKFWASATSPSGQGAGEWATLAEEVAGVGYWQLNPRTLAIKWSDGLFHLYGVPVGDEPDLTSAMAAVHPDDAVENAALLTAAIEYGTDYDSLVRLKRADGSWRTVKSRAVCQRDESGSVIAILGTCLDITETVEQGIALRQSETRYQLLAENMTEIIAEFSPSATITFINPATRLVLGYEPHEMVGHKTLEFTHPADVPSIVLAYVQLVSSGPEAAPIRLQHRALHKDGHWVWLESQPKVRFDENGVAQSIQDVSRDITLRKAAEARLNESETLHRLLAEQSKDIIVRAGKDGVLRYVSPACRILGFEPEELLGTIGARLVHPDDMESFQQNAVDLFLDRVPEGEPRREHRFRCRNGDWVWLQGNPTVRRDAKGEPLEIVNVFRDVTERRAKDALLAEALKAAEAASVAKAEFLANMSHELRTPLTSIIGFSDLLKEQKLDAMPGRFADRIVEASQALLAVVNDILDFSKLEAGQIAIKRERTDLEELLKSTLRLFAPQAEGKGVRLALDFERAVPRYFLLDPIRVRQVLINLIGNAVKFTEEGCVTLRVEHAKGLLRCTVMDTGAGIPAGNLPQLFKRFSQVDGSSRRSHGGTGLGLAICKGLVEAMQGTVSVESREGEGSAFGFEIPAVHIGAVERDKTARQDLTGLRVLAVDDNHANRALLDAVLRPLGLDLISAASGTEAVQVAACSRFDVILMDVHMPGFDGLAAANAIHGNRDGPNRMTPILAFTAETVTDATARDYAAAFQGIVAKPIVADMLVKALLDAARPGEVSVAS